MKCPMRDVSWAYTCSSLLESTQGQLENYHITLQAYQALTGIIFLIHVASSHTHTDMI